MVPGYISFFVVVNLHKLYELYVSTISVPQLFYGNFSTCHQYNVQNAHGNQDVATTELLCKRHGESRKKH